MIWHHANVWRESLGLPPKQFHVTLSATDNHELDKSVVAYVRAMGTEQVVNEAIPCGLEALDHLALALRSDLPTETMAVAEAMILLVTDSARGYIRWADAVASMDDGKLAMLAYAQAVQHNPSLLEFVVRRIRKYRTTAFYGPTVTLAEEARIPTTLQPLLLRRWPTELDTALSTYLWTTPTQSRERQHFDGVELPRNFSWVYPGRVAGMSTPRHATDIDTLISLGFTHILSLTLEEPLDPKWVYIKPIEHVYIPLPNYGIPTLAEMDAVLARVRAGGTWVVHCGGGVGRAGTILACLMTMLGPGPNESEANEPQMDGTMAIATLRRMRPRSLESTSQGHFVSSYVSHRWKIA